MKKNLIIVAIAMASTFGMNAVAQNNSECNKQQCNKEQCDKAGKKCEKGGKGHEAFNPFEGIQLTAEQQTKLDAIQKPCMKKDAKEAKAEKMKQKQAEKANRVAARKNYLESVKTVLTPEQYTQFLENIVLNQHDKMGRPHHDMKNMKYGKHAKDKMGHRKEMKRNGAEGKQERK